MSRIVEINWTPSDRILRQFGIIALAAFGVLAVSAWSGRLTFSAGLGSSRLTATAIFASLAIFSLLAALIVPRANLPLYLGMTVVSYPVGLVMSYVIMAVLFYAVFAPIAALMRILRRDPLHRKANRSALSYWKNAEQGRTANSYFRQF